MEDPHSQSSLMAVNDSAPEAVTEVAQRPYTVVSADFDALRDAAPVSAERMQAKRVFQGTGFRVIRLTFSAGQVMREHSTNSPILVQVLEGEIVFRIAGDEIVMPAGAMLHVEPSVMHELEAVTEAHVLLTLSL